MTLRPMTLRCSFAVPYTAKAQRKRGVAGA
jgi:hypothetical protein